MSIHDKIAAQVGGGELRCGKAGCDRGERVTARDVAGFLAHGWPMHHGMTMTFTPAHPYHGVDR